MINNIHVVDMHTGGEPVRIIVGGYPKVYGQNILEKRRYVRENLDPLRKLLMHEPRGHNGMYGVLPVKPDLPSADLAVLFMHNKGYSTMCGHAIIAFGRFAVDQGWVEVVEPETTLIIQCPCGPVIVHVRVKDGKSSTVRFESVRAFAFARGRIVNTEVYGPLLVDIGYGGAFYAVISADEIGLDIKKSMIRELVDAATLISAAVKNQVSLYHPDNDEFAFLYGTIITDGSDDYSVYPTANICVFADSQFDRSPTGSGVTARIAIQHRRGLIGLNQPRAFESVTGSIFVAKALEKSKCGKYPAVTVEVSGTAHYSGKSEFQLEESDDIGRGFLLK